MKKISKKVWLLIAAGIFVLALAGLFMAYSGKVDEQRGVNKQLADLQLKVKGVKLEPLNARQAELEEQLLQMTPQLEAAREKLSQPISSVNVTTILFGLAKTYDVTVTEMASTNVTTENLQGVTLSVLPLTAKVEGKALNLVTFITKLNSYFTTGVIKSVIITVPETVPEMTVADNFSAEIQMAVYSHHGD